MSASSYTYQPLDSARKEIRLLRHLGPGSDGLLRFEVSTVSLVDGQPTYYAVSYAWGDNAALANATIDGQVCTVPCSAEAALRGLYKAMSAAQMDSSTPIWIDAICINQNYLPEKSQQVADMGNIFSKASCVLVWLGDDDGSTRPAQKSLKSLARQCLEWTDGEKDLVANDRLPTAELEMLPYWTEKAPNDCDYRSMEQLLGCPFFHRLWVFQEIALARQLRCFRGVFEINWHDLSLASRWTYHVLDMWKDHVLHPYSFIQSLRFVRDVHDLKSAGGAILFSTFGQFCKTMITMETTEPRDKVYALLGLIAGTKEAQSIEEQRLLSADYKRPLAELFGAMILTTIRRSPEPLYALAACQRSCFPSEATSSWPSWVPQLHITQAMHSSPYRAQAAVLITQPCKVETHPHEPTVLRVAGIAFDGIRHIWLPPLKLDKFELIRSDPAVQDIVCKHYAKIWHRSFVRDLGLTWTKETLLCLAKALANAFQYDEDKLLIDFAAFLLEVREHCVDTDADTELSSLLSSIASSPSRDFLMNYIEQYGCVYPLFVTTSGCLGTGSNHIAIGDSICVLHGAEYTFVMRPWGNKWKLRGTCSLPSVNEEELARVIEGSETQIFDIN